jgi:hypothetical protein
LFRKQSSFFADFEWKLIALDDDEVVKVAGMVGTDQREENSRQSNAKRIHSIWETKF